MDIAVVSLFPDMFRAVSEYGITGRAFRQGLVRLTTWNPRDYARDRHRLVDDKPFGGGPGMLMKTGPLTSAIEAAKNHCHTENTDSQRAVSIYLSPQGRRLDQKGAEELAGHKSLILICGRYQGIDQRVLEADIDEEWSIGDYVVSGGELAAMVMIDAVCRHLPEVLGDPESVTRDSFMDGLLHCPQYTRPQEFRGRMVPEVLLSGDHRRIETWQRKNSLGNTWLKRPELLQQIELDSDSRKLLDEFISEYDG